MRFLQLMQSLTSATKKNTREIVELAALLGLAASSVFSSSAFVCESQGRVRVTKRQRMRGNGDEEKERRITIEKRKQREG
mgnify:CR=1 FL=1